MLDKKFDYPDHIRKESISIPSEIHTFMKTRPLKFPGRDKPTHIHIQLPKKGENIPPTTITYGGVVGIGPTKIPRELENNLNAILESYPLQNVTEEDQRNAEAVAVAAVKKLRGPGNYSVRRRDYMINTSSTPIRVFTVKDGKKERNPFYVKRPDLMRLMGKWLYDIISGEPRRPYFFNRAVFVEESIPGRVLSELDEKELLKQRQYREGVIRASVHSSFLDITDVTAPRNRIVSSNYSTRLFDFNIMFQGRMMDNDKNPFENYLLHHYQETHGDRYKWFNTPWSDKVLIDERNKVAKRVKADEERFFEMVRLMEDVEDNRGNTPRGMARSKYNSDSLENYFRKELSRYESA